MWTRRGAAAHWALAGAANTRRPFTTHYSVATHLGSVRVDAWHAPQFVGHRSSRGMRSANEDRYSIGFVDLPIQNTLRPVFTASVFDGHGGETCSDWLAANLARYVEEADVATLSESLPHQYRDRFGGYWRTLRRPLTARNERLYKRSLHDDLAVRLPLAYLAADFDETKLDSLTGSTATSVYIYAVDPKGLFWVPGTEVNITVAQVGDSRAILGDNAGNALALTTMHHASSTHEQDRLARYPLGFNTTSDGVQRFLQYVNTRAFGDLQGKSRGISAEPDLVEYKVTGVPRVSRAQPGLEAFLVLVSDGITDVVSDQEVCDLVIQQSMKGGSLRGTPQDAANEVVSYAGMLGSSDNATAVVIRLGGWGSWTRWSDRTGKQREDRLKHVFRRQ